MSRKLTLTIEITDEEVTNLLGRFSNIDRPATPAIETDDEDDNAPVNTNAPAVDANGAPWIEAVHASSKAFNKDGTWRTRKGVTPEARKAAEDAAKATAPATFTVPSSIAGTTAPVSLELPNAPVAAMPELPTFAAPAPAPVSFADVLGLYQKLQAENKIQPQNLFDIYAKLGLADGNNEIKTNETARANVFAALKQYDK